MIDYRRQTVLVTGASSGIGKAFAETLSGRGANVILVARSKGKLDALAASIRKSHAVTADVIVADLSDEAGPEKVFARVQRLRRRVDILINNAGVGAHGLFHAIPADKVQKLIMLNVAALARLTRLFVPGMLGRHSGIIVNVASTAAFQPVPYMAAYGASKAFVLSFSEALWAEYRSRGIRVLALCPGTTDTGFFKAAGESAAKGRKRPVAGVVAAALRALERGKSYVVDGGLNYLAAQSIKLSPRGLVASMAERVLRPKQRRGE